MLGRALLLGVQRKRDDERLRAEEEPAVPKREGAGGRDRGEKTVGGRDLGVAPLDSGDKRGRESTPLSPVGGDDRAVGLSGAPAAGRLVNSDGIARRIDADEGLGSVPVADIGLVVDDFPELVIELGAAGIPVARGALTATAGGDPALGTARRVGCEEVADLGLGVASFVVPTSARSLAVVTAALVPETPERRIAVPLG